MSGSVTLRRRAGTAAPHYAVWYPLTFLALRLEHYFVSGLNSKGQGATYFHADTHGQTWVGQQDVE
jgi:hypothetical protein